MTNDLLQRLDLLGRDNQIPICTLAAARIRELEAQIAATVPQPVAVLVKPLVWGVDHHGRRNHPKATRAECPIFGQVCAEKPTDQADVEARRAARILSAIEAVPVADARDAALEEAARVAGDNAVLMLMDLKPTANLREMQLRRQSASAAIRAMKGGAK